MNDDEARKKSEAIRHLFQGHPPKKPAVILSAIDEILNPPKKRKARDGLDRMEREGFDRER